MNLSQSTSEKLNAWLGPSTWHTKHDLDMARFHVFVNQYQKDHGFVVEENELLQEIKNRVSSYGVHIGEQLEDIIRDRISHAYGILDFLRHTSR